MRNVFEYLEYSFFTLFSRKFGRIVGSSLIVDIVGSILSGSIIFFALHTLEKKYFTSGNLSLEVVALEVCMILLILVAISLISIGWKAIVIPLRSIEGEEKPFQLWEDFSLFKKHFSYYLSYITWYSALILLWIILVAICGIGLWYIESFSLLAFFLFLMFIGLIIAQVALTFTWYNSLKQPSYGLTAFKESIRLTRGRKWQIFIKIIVFSFAIGLASGVISSLNSLLPSPSIESQFTLPESMTVSGEKIGMKIEKQDIQNILPTIEAFLPNLSIFYLLFRIEGVLSFAMIQIFLMRFSLDVSADIRGVKKE